MSRKELVGWLVLTTFWVVLIGHGNQNYLTWCTLESKFSLALMALAWAASMSFMVIGLTDETRDLKMTISRVPSVLLCSMSVVQGWSPRFGWILASLLLVSNTVVFLVLMSHARTEGGRQSVNRLARGAFVLAFTVGMSLQIYKLHCEGTIGVSQLFWGAAFVNYLITAYYQRLKRDSLLQWSFIVAAVCAIWISGICWFGVGG